MVSNAELERIISSFAFIKNELRNRLKDELTSDLLFVFKLRLPLKEFDKNYL